MGLFCYMYYMYKDVAFTYKKLTKDAISVYPPIGWPSISTWGIVSTGLPTISLSFSGDAANLLI